MMPADSVTLRQAWKWSKPPYVELIFRSNKLISNPVSGGEEAEKRIKSMLSQTRTSKLVYTAFICIGGGIPFAQYIVDPSPMSLATAIALSLILSFAYLVIYSLLILPSFADADAYALLSSLPLRSSDYSKIAMLSFFRTFDYLAIGSIIVTVSAVAVLTMSPLASALMFFASVSNVALAIFTGLWLSRLFYKSISGGGRSRGAVISRTIFIIAWGVAVMSVGLAFNAATTFLPYLNHVLSGDFSPALVALISLIHPFTFGLVISSLSTHGLFEMGVFGPYELLFAAISYTAALIYAVIAYAAASRTLHIISYISHGHGVAIQRETAKDFTVRLRSPVSSYMLKDIRISAKSPSTALILAFPVFEVIFVAVLFLGAGMLSYADIIVMTLTTSTISLFGGHLLLEAERKGLDYTLSLPLGRRLVVTSKSIISTLLFIPVPFAILLLQLAQPGGWNAVSLMPFIEMLALGAATTTEISILVTGRGSYSGASGREKAGTFRRKARPVPLELGGFSIVSGAKLGRMIAAVILAILMLVLPVVFYLFSLSVFDSGLISIAAMAAVAASEFAITQALILLRR